MMFRLPKGQEIRQIRRKRGLTQEQLAVKAGVSQSLIAKIERGTVNPRISTVNSIFQALQASKPCQARDIMSHPVTHVEVREKVKRAVTVMRESGFSQLPVLLNGMVVGGISESTILKHLGEADDAGKVMGARVETLMGPPFSEVRLNSGLTEVTRLLRRSPAVLVIDERMRMVGIITKIDVLGAEL